MPLKRTFLPPIPTGYQLYEAEYIQPKGIHYRKENAIRLVDGEEVGLEFQREPDNPHGRSAIMVVGGIRQGTDIERVHIGYVPHNLAERIVLNGFADEVRPRLRKIYVSDAGFIEIEFQIIGPKNRKKEWDATKVVEMELAATSDMELYRGETLIRRTGSATTPRTTNQHAGSGCAGVVLITGLFYLIISFIIWS